MGKRSGNDLALGSGLVFAILGALICTMLFTGEGRTYGQLVSASIGSIVGNTEWWKDKSYGFHHAFITMMVSSTFLIAFRNQIINYLKPVYLWITSKTQQYI